MARRRRGTLCSEPRHRMGPPAALTKPPLEGGGRRARSVEGRGIYGTWGRKHVRERGRERERAREVLLDGSYAGPNVVPVRARP